jgi:hypothetical protein
MKIGVTGTRSGMSEYQKYTVRETLLGVIERHPESELHHGDCVGVDVEVAEMARDLGFKVVCHPPVKSDLRAYHQSDEFRVPVTYFARNKNIVNETELLLVIPYQSTPQPTGGTWYTHDYARNTDHNYKVIYPESGAIDV